VGGKGKPRSSIEGEPAIPPPSLDRKLVNLLALLAVKGEKQVDQILTLSAAGFTPAEIASLLRTTANTVSVTLYQAKKEKDKDKDKDKGNP